MRPPTGPYLIDHLFGLSFLSVRWYGVLIMGGALLAALLAARRARARGIDPEHVWNQLILGLLIAIPLARAYYVAFEWPRYVDQEAYGRPTTLPWGLDIAPAYRIPPYDDLGRYPPETRFLPTFLYESLWDLSALGLIVWLERRVGERLKAGDRVLLYGVLSSLGRFGTEGLRTDSLCVGPYTADGSCAGGLRIAQLVSLGAFLLCGRLLLWRHRPRTATPVLPGSPSAEG